MLNNDVISGVYTPESWQSSLSAALNINEGSAAWERGGGGGYLSLRFSLPINPIESRSRVARPKPFSLRWENQRRLGTSQECTQREYFSSFFFSRLQETSQNFGGIKRWM